MNNLNSPVSSIKLYDKDSKDFLGLLHNFTITTNHPTVTKEKFGRLYYLEDPRVSTSINIETEVPTTLFNSVEINKQYTLEVKLDSLKNPLYSNLPLLTKVKYKLNELLAKVFVSKNSLKKKDTYKLDCQFVNKEKADDNPKLFGNVRSVALA